MNDRPAGFREREHTADWELEVWAGSLDGLFEQAARGMYALSGTRIQPGPRQRRTLELAASDPESLLVSFLSELLYLGEQEGLAFDSFELHVQAGSLQAHLQGGAIASQDKEIKAVTYHNLAIRRTGQNLEVNIVFDV